ncbi:type II toxin-antitoxin system antitoxin, RelB/DinJ family [Acerihabitans sp. KWT182]|uniref:Type II toxin-antitoxin system antitoxin, RelB/DinJ family n=1 Tax=Acerihabitans sp. KWT182 TaxID=3157919 RepID=A0AAU7QBD8_9GAMM
MADSVVIARNLTESKAGPQANVKALNPDVVAMISMVVNPPADVAELRADLLQPNKETLLAIHNLETGREVTRVNSVGDLKRGLGW